MELNKAKCKSLDEVFGAAVSRNDMRLPVMLVRRALGSPILAGEIADYQPEDVLPADILADKPKIVSAVGAALSKLRAENRINAAKQSVQDAIRAAQLAAKEEVRAALQDRDQAVWNMKRAIYITGAELPVDPPTPVDITRP